MNNCGSSVARTQDISQTVRILYHYATVPPNHLTDFFTLKSDPVHAYRGAKNNIRTIVARSGLEPRAFLPLSYQAIESFN